RHAAQEQVQAINRQRGQQKQPDLQQAAEKLAKHNFVIAKIGQQEQHKSAAVFFLGDGNRRRKRREKEDQRELNVNQHLELQQPKAGQIGEGGPPFPAHRRLPDR